MYTTEFQEIVISLGIIACVTLWFIQGSIFS
jgi:hypothetical protein